MKNIFTSSFLGLVISGLLLSSCSQMATYENEDLQLEQAKVSQKDGFVLTPLGGGNENAKTTAVSNFENFSLTYDDNVCPNQVVTATFGGSGFTGTRTIQIQEFIGGEWVQVFQEPQASTGTKANLGNLSLGVHTFRWSVSGMGGPKNVMFTVTVNDIVCCDSGFSGVTTCSEDGSEKTATYTFIAGEDGEYSIEGDLIEQASGRVVDGAFFFLPIDDPTGLGVIRWTGFLEECEEKTITVKWNSTNCEEEIFGDWTVRFKEEIIFTID